MVLQWMGPCPVWSSPGFYPWSATVYYLYIWALHTSGRNWSPRPALRGWHTSIHPLPTLKCFFGRWRNGSCTEKIGDMDVIQSPAPKSGKDKIHVVWH